MRIYIDIVFLLNFLVDFLLILGTNRLVGFPMEPLRGIVASAFGGIYGGACLLRSFRFLGGMLWRMLFLVLLSMVAFGYDRSGLKRGCVFFLLSMALGGVTVSIGQSDFVLLILAAGGMWLLCSAVFGEAIGCHMYLPLRITYMGQTVHLTALRDTGNTLRDPFSGEQVFLISPDAAGKLTGLSREQLQKPMETLAHRPVPGLRLIPFQSVGNPGGMLLAMRFEQVTIGGQSRSAVVAFAPYGLGEGQCYQALVT